MGCGWGLDRSRIGWRIGCGWALEKLRRSRRGLWPSACKADALLTRELGDIGLMGEERRYVMLMY